MTGPYLAPILKSASFAAEQTMVAINFGLKGMKWKMMGEAIGSKSCWKIES